MKFTVLVLSHLIICVLCLSCDFRLGNDSKNNKSLNGKVISIVDGDTFDVLLDGNVTVRVRMEGIDAPEKGMPFYRVSKNYLSELCFNKMVRLQVNDTDSHQRKIAFSYLQDGRELSHEMLKAGLAWHFVEYNQDQDLAQLEAEARREKRGLWADPRPMTPWENRKLHRNGISTKDSFNIQQGRD